MGKLNKPCQSASSSTSSSASSSNSCGWCRFRYRHINFSRLGKACRQLQLQLGQEVPPDLKQAIQQQKDLATITGWLEQVLTVADLDQARHVLGLTNGSAKPGN